MSKYFYRQLLLVLCVFVYLTPSAHAADYDYSRIYCGSRVSYERCLQICKDLVRSYPRLVQVRDPVQMQGFRELLKRTCGVDIVAGVTVGPSLTPTPSVAPTMEPTATASGVGVSRLPATQSSQVSLLSRSIGVVGSFLEAVAANFLGMWKSLTELAK